MHDIDRAEAIRLLDPQTTEQALQDYETFQGQSGKKAQLLALCMANELALEALREPAAGEQSPAPAIRQNSLCHTCLTPLRQCPWLLTFRGQPGMVVYYKRAVSTSGSRTIGIVQQCPKYQKGEEHQ